MAATETLLFAAPGKVQILTDGKTQDWGKSCKVTAEGLSGLTLDNRPFLIQYQTANGKGRLTCKVQPPPNPMYKANDGTWVAEEGGPGTVEPPPHVGDHGPAKG